MNRQLHIDYFLNHLRMLPEPYSSQDINRVVLAFFCVHGLGILDALDKIDKEQIIEWVYNLQVHPDAIDRGLNWEDCGFRGGTYMGNEYNCEPNMYRSSTYDTSSIATTYAALCILHTLGDDLTRVNRKAILKALKNLQCKETGSFSSVRFGSEQDMRFVFCACGIAYLLNDWSGIDKDAMVQFINESMSFDGAIGICPGLESQGGATYCALASLALSNRLLQLNNHEDVLHWLCFRQVDGFQGRCNKPPDSCYAFWNGGSLDILRKHPLIDIEQCRKFIYSCAFKYGGFCKFPNTYPDIMHSYYSLAWLSISKEEGLKPMNTKLQIPNMQLPSYVSEMKDSQSTTSTKDTVFEF